jgi:DNA-binding CsgD family transcriptional regulator
VVAAHPDDVDHIAEFNPDVVIVAPQTWEELSRWLPSLERRFGAAMWLVWARLRVAGMFSSFLVPHFCTILGTLATSRELRTNFWSLVNHDPECPPAALLARIARGVWAALQTRRPVRLTDRQLQCGCAVSLGLTNARIGAALSIAEGTVAKHVSALLQALGMQDRQEIGELFERAVFPGSTSF